MKAATLNGHNKNKSLSELWILIWSEDRLISFIEGEDCDN